MNNLVKALVVAAILAGVFLVAINTMPDSDPVTDNTDETPAVSDVSTDTPKGTAITERMETVLVTATGVVKTEDGSAVSDALVVVYTLTEGRSEIIRETRTDEDGAFKAVDVPVGSYRFMASKSSYQTAKVEKILAEGIDNSVELVLKRGLSISGRVLNLAGAPIANAEVRAFIEHAPKDADITKRLMVLVKAEQIQEDFGVTATTDSSGLYEVTGLEPGEYRMMALADNYAPGNKQYVPVGSSEVDFALDRGAVLVGTVQTMGMRPIPGAVVQVYPQTAGDDLVETVLMHLRPPLAEAETDANGYYEFRQLGGDNEFRVRFTAPAYQSQEFEKVVVSEGSEPLDVQLADGHVIAGVVYDPDGRPLEGATIKANAQGAPKGNPTSALGDDGIRTDEHGRFSLDTLQQDMKYRIVASHQDFATWAQSHIEPSQEEELEIHMEIGGAVQGRVLDATTGEGIAGAIVNVRDTGGDKIAYSNETGEYYVRGITVSRRKKAHFSFKAEGYTSRTNEKISVANGTVTEEQDIELDRNGSVSGTVVDASGAPVPGVSVTVKRQHSPSVPVVVNASSTVVSDKKGSFYIPDVRTGDPGFLVGEHPDFLESAGESFDMPAGEEVTDLVLTMNLGGSLSGRIIDAGTNEPIRGATVAISDDNLLEMDPSSLPKNARTNADGEFVIGSLTPGSHTLVVKADSYLSYEQSGIVVEESFDSPVGDIALAPSSFIAGIVTDSNGNRISGAKVTVKDSSDGFRKETRKSRSDGSFRVDNLGEYPVDVEVTAKGFTKTELLEVAVNREDVDIVLEKLGSIRGLVVDAANNPLMSFAVSPKVSKKGRFVAPVSSKTFQRREDGTFYFGNLPPGRYEVGVGSPGYSFEKRHNIVVDPDRTTDIGVIVLEEGSKIAGYVVDKETGAPIERAMVTVVGGKKSLVGQDRDNPSRRAKGQGGATTGSDGYFEITGIASRNITLKIKSPGYVDERVRVRGGNQELTVELSAGGGISGTVYDADGNPAEGVGVYLTGTKHDRGVTDRRGHYQFRSLPVGGYQVRAANLLGEDAKFFDRQMRSGALEEAGRQEQLERERRAREDAEMKDMDPDELKEVMRRREEENRRNKKSSSARGGRSGLAAMRNAKVHRVQVRPGDVTVQDIYLDAK